MNDLIVLVGPTASGKTALGAALAENIGGEVISADAFAVYRGLDIGTAKPDRALRARVPHHLIDIADPRSRYSAGMFVRDADEAIGAIRARNRVPVIVGGTHFYVRALLYGLFAEPARDGSLRAELERDWEGDPGRVRARLEELDPDAALRILPNDRQRVLRALEVCVLSGRPMTELWKEHSRREVRYAVVMLGLNPPRAMLHATIALRVERMFAAGLLHEVDRLLASGLPSGVHALKAIGYRESCRVLAGTLTIPEAVERATVATRQLAKRQMTWLRSESDVHWLTGELDEALAQASARVEGRRGTGTGAV
ncbi:MAG: tRNA (adenosine(37)-N6)-dimethylallyltransferase MiaA [Acidobacteriia bacterium]|nr:tRNA (adenosine(37)-N6)-dimethylallyltransferase MiaA [Terriglobia bacterium]